MMLLHLYSREDSYDAKNVKCLGISNLNAHGHKKEKRNHSSV